MVRERLRGAELVVGAVGWCRREPVGLLSLLLLRDLDPKLRVVLIYVI